MVESINHPAASFLATLQDKGLPVILDTPPWTPEHKQQALKRGPHKSSYEYGDFILEGFLEFLHKGFWFILPAWLVMDLGEL